MNNTTVRISDTSRNILRELAAQENASMQAVLEKAIEAYRRQYFLLEVNRAYAVIRKDQHTWSEVREDRTQWDTTLGDGLNQNERWSQNGNMNFGDVKREEND